VQKGYNAGNTVVGGMLTSTNRFIGEPSLEFLTHDAYTGGLDLLHHWKDKEFYVDARLTGSYVNGTVEAIRRLQESSAHYFQKPGVNYLDYDTTSTSMSGYGGKLKVGKGSKGFWRYSAGVTWLSPGIELNDLGYMRSADYINEENEISYLINKPVSIFHTYSINLEQFNSWNFNGTYLGSGGHLSFNSEFKNNWSLGANLIFHSKQTDTRLLRGGPDMITPYSLTTFGDIRSDPSKKIIIDLAYEYESSGNNSAMSYQIEPGFSVRPFSALKIGVSANYADNNNDLQYVATRNYLSGKRYILGTIDQQTLGLTFRVDVNISPEFSIQYYGSPFISRGSYWKFKYVINPEGQEYESRFAMLNYKPTENNTYLLDEDNDDIADYSIANPDFNFYQFRSNLVAKWEYRLGSFIYLVWSSDRTGSSSSGNMPIGDSFNLLGKAFPNNIFLIKLNYWFTL
jgi:hypothetical protein